MNLFDSIGPRLREVRESLGKSQIDFVQAIAAAGARGATRQSQSLYEKGERMPDAAYLAVVGQMGGDVAYVITGRREPKPANRLTEAPAPGYPVQAVTQSPSVPAHPGALQTGGLSGLPWGDLLAPADVSVARPLRLSVIYQAGQIRREYQVIPRFKSAASAGLPGARQLTDDEAAIDAAGVLAMDRAYMREQLGSDKPGFATVVVKGDSMERTLIDGETIVIDTDVVEVDCSGIYVLRAGKNMLVKRLILGLDGSVLVKSDNPTYSAYAKEFTAEQAAAMRVLGRMVWPRFR